MAALIAELARSGVMLAGYVRRMFEAGIPLAIGTDWVEPGRVTLSEMLVLHRAGIPMKDVLAIATRGGAQVLEREADYGAVEPGRKAHLVIFDRNPLDNPTGVLGEKTVIKDGLLTGNGYPARE